jgi:hypothetical protein
VDESRTILLQVLTDGLATAMVVDNNGMDIDSDSNQGSQITPAVKEEFRDSLRRHLFKWEGLMSLRIRLAFCDFAWVHSFLCVFDRNIDLFAFGDDRNLLPRIRRNSFSER